MSDFDPAPGGRGPLDHLRIKHLRLIEHIRETGSLSASAQRLSLSQPAVTGMVHDLEAAFGARLFERTARGATLNEAGRLALERLRHALTALDAARRAVAEAPRVPLLRLGFLPLTAISLVPRALRLLESQGELPRLVCRQDAAPELIAALHRGELDGVLGVLDQSSLEAGLLADLKFDPIAREGLMAACSPRHPLADGGEPSLARLLEERWILPPVTSHTYRALESAFVAAGLAPPQGYMESAAFQANLAIAGATSLLTVAPISAVRRARAEGRVRGIAIAALADSNPLFFITHRDGPDMRGLWRLKAALEAAGRDGAGP